MAYELYIKNSDTLLGTISDEQLEELVELLEEEGAEDHDYYIDKDVLAFLEQEQANPELVSMLGKHVTDGEGIEVEWRAVVGDSDTA